MRQKKIIPILFFSFLLTSCSLFNRSNFQTAEFHSDGLKKLILRAIEGDTTANKALNYFTDPRLPVNNDYSSLEVDSLTLTSGKKYFTVLIGFSNPIYNRFAVYDSTLRLYLIDRSLNGYLNDTILKIGSRKLIKVSESFTSKDTLSVKRISLFQVNDSSAGLIFRAFTQLIELKKEFNQTITEISDDRIKTELSSTKNSPIANKADIFLYNYSKMKYLSENNIFDNFVIDEIKNFGDKSEKPEIIDVKSMYASAGIDIALDTIKTTGNTKDKLGYTLTLPENWKTLKNLALTEFLNKEFNGTRYLNDEIGASISIIMIPVQDSAEMFIKYKLKFTTLGKYKVRYSDKIQMRKDFVQFFEYSCGTKKYILILNASKFTYEKYKDIYQNIINSFTIDC